MEPAENSPSYVQLQFTMQIGQGQLSASATVPAGQTSLVGILPALQDLSSSFVDATVESVKSEGYSISCCAGCGACCRQLVPLTPFEAEGLANWVRGLPPEQQAVLERRFNKALVELKEKGVLDRLDFRRVPAPGSQEERQLAMDYLLAGVACPFLEDESCSIHPIRPLICREYLVTSPAQFCAMPTKETVRPVPMPVKLSVSLCNLGTHVTGSQRGWIPLVFLFEWIKNGLTVGDGFNGTGPELLQLVLEQLAPEASANETA